MKNFLALFIAISCAFILSAQNKAGDIVNKVGPEHIRVEGAKIYMVPPANFEQVLGSIGFKDNNSDNSIIIREAVGSYKSSLQSFLSENLIINGIKIVNQEKFLLNGNEATLFTLTQKVNRKSFGKYLLFFGDDDYNVMISAVFPEGDQQAAEIKKSMLSVAYPEESKDSPMPAGFKLDFSGTGLKFARSLSDAVMYTADGKTSVNSLIRNSFFAGSNKEIPTDKAAYSLERLQKQIKTKLTIEENKPIQIQGLSGYEITASTIAADGTSRSLYQVLLFAADKYFILYGSATENREERIATFKKIVKSFELEK